MSAHTLVEFEKSLRTAGMKRAGSHRWQCPFCLSHRTLKVSIGSTRPLVMHCFSDNECYYDEILDALDRQLSEKGLEHFDRQQLVECQRAPE